MVIPLKDDNPARGTPILTLLIIAACVLVYFAVQPRTDAAEEQIFLFENAAVPCEVTEGQPLSNALSVRCDQGVFNPDTAPRQEYFPDKNVYLSLLSSMFLHGSILHLGGNMLFLWIFGNNMEDRFGKFGFVLLYLLTGVGATLVHVFTQPDSTVPVIGASGAIAGVMGAYLVYFPHARILTVVPVLFLVLIRLPAFVVLLIWFGMQFLTNPNTGVAVAAHIGGFVLGALLAVVVKLLLHNDEPRRPDFGFDPHR
ncbi:MAG: rhomboid family intramembrane serine protease [Acidimicrobiia bacterium]